MVKQKFTWKDWWMEILKGTPLLSTIIITFFAYGIVACIIVSIIVVYIANLYDKEWQKRIHS